VNQPDRQQARAAASKKREMLQQEIERSSATTEQKAFMAQHLAHLWTYAGRAMDDEEART
jgi:hypothetical protein